MEVKKARQILKSLADDNRLRIVNLLSRKSLNVAELCEILKIKQSNLSRHLTRLRLTGIVSDKREGQYVYYCLNDPKSAFMKALITSISEGLKDTKYFIQDNANLKKVKK
jgi:ArsR family transcriptional regulator